MNNFAVTSMTQNNRKISKSKSKLKNKSFSQHNNTHISNVP